MPEHVYKTVELTGSSSESTDAAIRHAIRRAGETLHGLRWFEVTDIRGHIDGDEVAHWQVTLKLGFTLDDGPAGD